MMNLNFVSALVTMMIEFPERRHLLEPILKAETDRIVTIKENESVPLQPSVEWNDLDILRVSGKIPAIKEVRCRTGLGLKEAKCLIEASQYLGLPVDTSNWKYKELMAQ